MRSTRWQGKYVLHMVNLGGCVHAVVSVWPGCCPATDRREDAGARLIAVIRDPVDRASSNGMHLRSDGLETISDFNIALGYEDARVAAGCAPFWHCTASGVTASSYRTSTDRPLANGSSC